MTPAITTLPPTEQMPDANAHSNMEPEIRVSLPIKNVGCSFSLPKCVAAARPKWYANSGVKNSLTTPRTPSVPNNRAIFSSVYKRMYFNLCCVYYITRVCTIYKIQVELSP